MAVPAFFPFILTSSILSLLSCAYAQSPSPLTTIQYGAFTKTATYSIANTLNYFGQVGLDVQYQQVPNSTFGYAQLLNGGYDVLTGTIDNAVNLRFNSLKPITVLGQLDGGTNLVIASVPNITSIQGLRGHPIIVDSPVSGYAYILRKVLSLHGLRLENGDYTFQVGLNISSQIRGSTDLILKTVGSTGIRYADLTAGMLPNGSAVYATILTYPYTAEALNLNSASPPNILATISDYIQPLSSSAITVAQSSIADTTKNGLITKFVAAMYAANCFLADRNNKPMVIWAIANTLNISIAGAVAEYVAATDPLTGETSSPHDSFNVNRQGLLNVIDVRSQFNGFAGAGPKFDFASAIQPGVGKFIDYSVRDQAVAMVNGMDFQKRYYESQEI